MLLALASLVAFVIVGGAIAISEFLSNKNR